jgi:ribonuclease Z
VAYSSDTAVSERVARMARGADVLIHEASGDYPGHSTAVQAGQVAERASVHSLYLVHYPALDANLNALKAEAEKEFSGSVHLARDFGAIEF